jgi:hypothetical protein
VAEDEDRQAGFALAREPDDEVEVALWSENLST